MKSLVLFDCYQTLIYKKDRELIVQKFLEHELHVQVPIRHIAHAFDVMYHRYNLNQPKFKTSKSRKKFYEFYNKELLRIIGFDISTNLAAKLHEDFRPSLYVCYPDVIPALEHYACKGKYSLGVIANWTEGLETILAKLKLDAYFDFVYSSHGMSMQKPDPKIFKKTLKNVVKKYDRIYYIGDDYELDVVPARQAGLTPILIDRNNAYPEHVDCLKVKTLQGMRKIII